MSTDPFDSYLSTPASTAGSQISAKTVDQPIEKLDGTDEQLDTAALSKRSELAGAAPSNGSVAKDEGDNTSQKGKQKGKTQRHTASPRSQATQLRGDQREMQDLLDRQEKPKGTRSRARVEKPDMTLDMAIAQGKPTSLITELVKQWSAYEKQEARIKADAEAADRARELERQATEARRTAANILLSLADICGCSMSAATEIYQDALVSKFPDMKDNIAHAIAQAEAKSRTATNAKAKRDAK